MAWQDALWTFADCDARFNTPCFLFGFLPLVLLVYWAVPKRSWKQGWVAAASMLFYAMWDWRFVPLLVFAAVLDFFVAIRLEASDHRRRWLLVSLIVNLGVLAVFKYTLFAAQNVQSLLTVLGLEFTPWRPDIVLPVGISFYTFQTMSYTIDVYRGDVPATRNLTKYLAYVALFPQLVAGPIVRYRDVSAHMDALPTRPESAWLRHGAFLFALGLWKKVFVADTIASVVDPLWADPGAMGTAAAWLAALGYTAQLYFDFSGYSDMAIGLGAMMGLRFPINFDAPYQARNPSDFWRRWHISLSSWLRDYLYVPLGGNRAGRLLTLRNAVIVMALGGLWHGAAWTFVVWGLYHGGLLVAYQLARPAWDRWPAWVQRGGTFLLVVIGWVFFRALDLADAAMVLARMVVPTAGETVAWTSWALVLLALGVAMILTPAVRESFRASRWQAIRTGSAAAMAVLIVLSAAQSPFLYYQF